MNTIFIKKSMVFVYSLMILILLAACSGNNGESAGAGEQNGKGNASGSKDNAATGEKIKLSYWTMDRHDMDYMQEQIDKYNETNEDNIEVEMKVMADNYNQSIEVAFVSNQAPDILQVNDFQAYVSKGYLAPLDDMFSEEFLQRFDGLLVDNVYKSGGKTYAFPNTGQFWRLLYNVDLLEQAGYTEPPKTLAEMVEIAKKITENGKADGVYGFSSNFKSGSGFTRPAYAVGSLGSSTSNEGFNYQTGEFDFAMFRDVTEALRQIRADGSLLPGSEALDIDPLRAQFAQGKIGMYVNHSSEPSVYESQFPTDINWASAIVPTANGEINGVTWVNATGYVGINAKTPHKEAAAKFLEFIYSTELRVEYQEKGLGLSVLPYVNEAAADPELKGIEDFLPTQYDGIYPANPLGITESKLEGKKMADAFTEYIFTGTQDIDTLISDLNTRYAKALATARSEGLTNIEADPGFDAKNLQGTLSK